MLKDQMTTKDMDVRALSGEEIDTVNGGGLGLLLLGIGVGALVGYAIYKALD